MGNLRILSDLLDKWDRYAMKTKEFSFQKEIEMY